MLICIFVQKGMQSQGTALLSLGIHQVITTSKTSQSSTEAISLEVNVCMEGKGRGGVWVVRCVCVYVVYFNISML